MFYLAADRNGAALEMITNVSYYAKRAKLFCFAGSSNGRIADSESVHLGSNPSPAADMFRLRHGGVAKQSLSTTS